MANILVLGGGFGSVVAAQKLVKTLGNDNQVTVISKSTDYVFYPGLVRLAFGECSLQDVTFDLREAMSEKHVRFIKDEVAHIDFERKTAILTHGEIEGSISYDYLIIATGRRLATEKVPGFFEYANHMLSVNAAIKFGQALEKFEGGSIVLGYCPGARLAIPIYETAYSLDRMLKKRGIREKTEISIVTPYRIHDYLGTTEFADRIHSTLPAHGIRLIEDFPVNRVEKNRIDAESGETLPYDLLMLIPPFSGPGTYLCPEYADGNGYIEVNEYMEVEGAERVYAVGDCTNIPGPKVADLAIKQAEVAAENIVHEITGSGTKRTFTLNLTMMLDEGGGGSMFFHKDFSKEGVADIKQSTIWGWTKRRHQWFWQNEYRHHSKMNSKQMAG
jgi:sulfide:quinone oxidoreductase